jgi:hypothetical protein
LVLGNYFSVYPFAAELTTDLIGWINNHSKVWKVFDAAQEQISIDQMGQPLVLAYLPVNITRWTTHCVAFIRLIHVQEALKLKVMQHHTGVVTVFFP